MTAFMLSVAGTVQSALERECTMMPLADASATASVKVASHLGSSEVTHDCGRVCHGSGCCLALRSLSPALPGGSDVQPAPLRVHVPTGVTVTLATHFPPPVLPPPRA